jgi:uncharacterized protein (DUF1697 family)
MDRYIALFRGINVGGNSTLPMPELVEILERVGAVQVTTYIQSGNAVFGYAGDDLAELSKKISSEVKRRKGFAPKVLILTPAGLEKAIVGNPFPEAVGAPSSLHLGFLAEEPKDVNLERLNNFKTDSEQFRLTPEVFYLYAPEGVGKSGLAAGVEKALGVDMTDRNWRTVCKIRELVNSK